MLLVQLEQDSAANELFNNWLTPLAFSNNLKFPLSVICDSISQEEILILLPFYRAKKAVLIKHIIEIYPSFQTEKL